MSTPKPDFAATVSLLNAMTARLRGATRAALGKVLPGPSGARACGRALGLRRSLGWQVYSLAHATDAATVLRALPRSKGFELIQRALRDAGCPHRELEALLAESKALESFLKGARIDRDMLRAAAGGGLDTARERQSTLRARRAATDANERIFGISALSTVTSVLLGPSGKDGRFDAVSATVFHGMRRSRAGAPWPVYQSAEMRDSRAGKARVARDGGVRGGLRPFVEDLSTPGIGRNGLARRKNGGAILFELADRGEQRTQGVRLCFLEMVRGGGGSEHPGQRSELHLSTNLPIRAAAFEVWIHRSHRVTTQPSASLVGSPRVFGSFPDPPENLRLPLEADAEKVESPRLPEPMRGCIEAHAELLERGFAAMRGRVEEFEGFRVVVRDPPIHCRIVLAWRM